MNMMMFGVDDLPDGLPNTAQTSQQATNADNDFILMRFCIFLKLKN